MDPLRVYDLTVQGVGCTIIAVVCDSMISCCLGHLWCHLCYLFFVIFVIYVIIILFYHDIVQLCYYVSLQFCDSVSRFLYDAVLVLLL